MGFEVWAHSRTGDDDTLRYEGDEATAMGIGLALARGSGDDGVTGVAVFDEDGRERWAAGQPAFRGATP